jgi:hypothetical protein
MRLPPFRTLATRRSSGCTHRALRLNWHDQALRRRVGVPSRRLRCAARCSKTSHHQRAEHFLVRAPTPYRPDPATMLGAVDPRFPTRTVVRTGSSTTSSATGRIRHHARRHRGHAGRQQHQSRLGGAAAFVLLTKRDPAPSLARSSAPRTRSSSRCGSFEARTHPAVATQPRAKGGGRSLVTADPCSATASGATGFASAATDAGSPAYALPVDHDNARGPRQKNGRSSTSRDRSRRLRSMRGASRSPDSMFHSNGLERLVANGGVTQR